VTFKPTMCGTLGLATAVLLNVNGAAAAAPPAVATVAQDKPRLIVITDIGTEPDDLQSMVRLLTYANEFDIEGLIASTSSHLRDRTYPQLIEERVRAYGKVLPNLKVHAPGWPEAATLQSRIRAHSPLYGMAGVGDSKDSDASRLIIDTVDKADARPVWVSIWGGAAPLAQALWSVRASRSPAEVERFVAKLRVYSISDQDDAGPWARAMFPKLFWISSIHGPTQYELAAWTGISADSPGADPSMVSRQWLNDNIRSKGPLGATYPRPMFIMEGDSPSFLYLIPNGLGSPEHPNWGSWGGRYEKLSPPFGLWADAQDAATGIDGKPVKNNKVTVWRWRQAFQNDFAARMNWSVTPRFADANHPPELRLNGQAGQAPVEISVCTNQPVRLTAAGSHDPDGQPLTYRWWHYSEVSGALWSPDLKLSAVSGETTTVTVPAWTQPANMHQMDNQTFHVILEATDTGDPALTRYRRAVVTVPTKGGSAGGQRCRPVKVAQKSEEVPSFSEPVGRLDGYSVAETDIGALVDDPAARAILDKYLPSFASRAAESPQGRGMTLKAVQSFDPRLTPEVMAKIDDELARIKPK
jgi:hypothetical protein